MFTALMEAGLDNIQFSLYAQNAADHKYITGTDTFARVVGNIRTAIRLRAESGGQKPYLQVFMMHCQETAATTQAFLEEWTPLVDQAFLRPLYNLGRDMPGMTPVFEKEIPSSRHPCVVPWYSTAIRSNGDVLPCYMFHWQRGARDVVIGNINEHSLEEIWRSRKFLEFREAHLKLALADHRICEDCDLWAAYTDIWKPDVAGGFTYAPVQARDFFRVARGYRGG
jgi:radical SAM protein with 4Fe4S-binding SPASM domain